MATTRAWSAKLAGTFCRVGKSCRVHEAVVNGGAVGGRLVCGLEDKQARIATGLRLPHLLILEFQVLTG
jgi:hypothetical protein